jgi:WD40 repeat protein
MTGGGRLCEFSHDGRWIVSGSTNGSARVWDARSGEPVGEPMLHAHRIRVVRISPDGTRVITGSDDGTARLWDARTGQPVGGPLAHRGPV